jgi:hypothetical protein
MKAPDLLDIEDLEHSESLEYDTSLDSDNIETLILVTSEASQLIKSTNATPTNAAPTKFSRYLITLKNSYIHALTFSEIYYYTDPTNSVHQFA